jgi:uncharacterized membrane protein
MIDEIGFLIFLASLIVYLGVIFYSYKSTKPTRLKILNEIYKNWAHIHVKKERHLIAIQALRNFTMGNSIFISAFFILLGILIGFYTSGSFNSDPFWGITQLTIGLVQISVNLIIIMFCVINFSLSIRSITRLSLLITADLQDYSTVDFTGVDFAEKTFIAAKNHWMAGVRGLFYLIATLIWFVNSLFFIVTTIVMTIYLITIHDVKLF